jgi:transcription antitermination factor NusG
MIDTNYRETAVKVELDWFAFRVRPRHEKSIAWQLHEKREECFVPLIRQKRNWANRVSYVDLPLIPGYVFCRTFRGALLTILKTSGVIDVVRTGRTPAPIKPEEIHALQRAIDAYIVEPCGYVEIGQTVEILRGPLAGVSGTVVERRNKKHVALSVSLLRRSVIVHVDLAAVCDDPEILTAVSEEDYVA